MTRPLIYDYVTLGFNSTTRYLEAMAKAARTGNSMDSTPLVAVFAFPDGKPPILYSHLPLLCKSASKSYPLSQEIRVVSLPRKAEPRLSNALGIPRVCLIGVREGADGSVPLVEYLRDQVAPLNIPWLENASGGIFLQTEIKDAQTTVSLGEGVKKGA